MYTVEFVYVVESRYLANIIAEIVRVNVITKATNYNSWKKERKKVTLTKATYNPSGNT